ncbi:M3 family metallopeptidase [Roseicyclus sp. F158]|uniref:M3 family metallopeptidase n=1 Tax=Tropicimonas omnivorans TaxID=3075590 RepID=A0ABU3DE51_9RHOB|nr:M3 family metallopeptidase [Roseicyclus sp. F158]MDT0681995.1 M3 family metallopeptidase [Roseicyclus sp. F158]
MTNPLLAPRNTPFTLPDFPAIADDQFAPAFEEALEEARSEIERIATNPEAPDFANTIEALERQGKSLHDVLSVFYFLASVDSNDTRQALQREFGPKLASYRTDIVQNPALFQRIEAVWQARSDLGLDDQEARLLYLTRRSFVRAGAALEGEARERMRAIGQRMSELSTAFGQNLLADERDWRMPLSEAQVEGLPAFLADAVREAGGEEGPAVTLSRSVLVPFLQSCPDRALRRRAWEAWTGRGAGGGETDNRAIVAETLALRHERAQLLGYDDYASWQLETEMAKTPDAVRGLLMEVWTPARAAADADAERLEKLLHADGETGPLEPWDWRYYSEKLRRSEHDLDEEEVKPYFQLARMTEAAFDCANRLFGLEFREIDVPLHTPDAFAWEVTRDGRHMGVLIGDYFARPGKRSGAWCTTLRDQETLSGEIRPHVLNVCNFAKPSKGKPALLSFDDARTLFHEFGHALHQLLSDVRYASMSGTSVPRDFVELPSQLYEHWLEVPEVLTKHALHAETGDAMPQALLDRVLAAATFDTGFQTVEYIASALVDLDFHQGRPPADPMQRQAEVLEELGMPRAIAMRHAAPHFAHVFAGGYASSYYSYMWSEVMDADAFAAFAEAGDPFDAGVAARLEEMVLSAGGRQEPDELYLAFRGRLPGPEALLQGRGLAPTPPAA